MSKKLLGILIVIGSLLVYSLYSVDISTPAKWQKQFDCEIYSEPISASSNILFWGGKMSEKKYKLFVIDTQGNKIAESISLPSSLFEPIVIGDIAIVADHARMLRGFSLPHLRAVWEAGSNDIFDKPPMKCGKNVIQGSGRSIFCLSPKTGKQLWDITELEPIKNYTCDKVVISIHGQKDTKNPIWKCSAYEIEDGAEIWKLAEPVSSIAPIFVRNTCILTTKEGEGIILNQFTGEILYRTGAKGLVQVIGLDDSAIFAGMDFRNIVFFSLLTGKSWTTTINKDLVGAVQLGSRVVIADKVSVRCFDTASGDMLWSRKFGEIYSALPHRSGVFLAYKENFFAKETYAVCLGANSEKELWVAQGNSLFRKPYPLTEGDLLLSHSGNMRLMPIPVFNDNKISIPGLEMPDPTKKIFDAFEKQNQKSNGNHTHTKNDSVSPEAGEQVAEW